MQIEKYKALLTRELLTRSFALFDHPLASAQKRTLCKRFNKKRPPFTGGRSYYKTNRYYIPKAFLS